MVVGEHFKTGEDLDVNVIKVSFFLSLFSIFFISFFYFCFYLLLKYSSYFCSQNN